MRLGSYNTESDVQGRDGALTGGAVERIWKIEVVAQVPART